MAADPHTRRPARRELIEQRARVLRVEHDLRRLPLPFLDAIWIEARRIKDKAMVMSVALEFRRRALEASK